jgi:hypothetical protein
MALNELIMSQVFVYQKNSFPKKCMGPASLYFIPKSNHIADAGIDQNPDKQIEVK